MRAVRGVCPSRRTCLSFMSNMVVLSVPAMLSSTAECFPVEMEVCVQCYCVSYNQ